MIRVADTAKLIETITNLDYSSIEIELKDKQSKLQSKLAEQEKIKSNRI